MKSLIQKGLHHFKSKGLLQKPQIKINFTPFYRNFCNTRQRINENQKEIKNDKEFLKIKDDNEENQDNICPIDEESLFYPYFKLPFNKSLLNRKYIIRKYLIKKENYESLLPYIAYNIQANHKFLKEDFLLEFSENFTFEESYEKMPFISCIIAYYLNKYGMFKKTKLNKMIEIFNNTNSVSNKEKLYLFSLIYNDLKYYDNGIHSYFLNSVRTFSSKDIAVIMKNVSNWIFSNFYLCSHIRILVNIVKDEMIKRKDFQYLIRIINSIFKIHQSSFFNDDYRLVIKELLHFISSNSSKLKADGLYLLVKPFSSLKSEKSLFLHINSIIINKLRFSENYYEIISYLNELGYLDKELLQSVDVKDLVETLSNINFDKEEYDLKSKFNGVLLLAIKDQKFLNEKLIEKIIENLKPQIQNFNITLIQNMKIVLNLCKNREKLVFKIEKMISEITEFTAPLRMKIILMFETFELKNLKIKSEIFNGDVEIKDISDYSYQIFPFLSENSRKKFNKNFFKLFSDSTLVIPQVFSQKIQILFSLIEIFSEKKEEYMKIIRNHKSYFFEQEKDIFIHNYLLFLNQNYKLQFFNSLTKFNIFADLIIEMDSIDEESFEKLLKISIYYIKNLKLTSNTSLDMFNQVLKKLFDFIDLKSLEIEFIGKNQDIFVLNNLLIQNNIHSKFIYRKIISLLENPNELIKNSEVEYFRTISDFVKKYPGTPVLNEIVNKIMTITMMKKEHLNKNFIRFFCECIEYISPNKIKEVMRLCVQKLNNFNFDKKNQKLMFNICFYFGYLKDDFCSQYRVELNSMIKSIFDKIEFKNIISYLSQEDDLILDINRFFKKILNDKIVNELKKIETDNIILPFLLDLVEKLEIKDLNLFGALVDSFDSSDILSNRIFKFLIRKNYYDKRVLRLKANFCGVEDYILFSKFSNEAQMSHSYLKIDTDDFEDCSVSDLIDFLFLIQKDFEKIDLSEKILRLIESRSRLIDEDEFKILCQIKQHTSLYNMIKDEFKKKIDLNFEIFKKKLSDELLFKEISNLLTQNKITFSNFEVDFPCHFYIKSKKLVIFIETKNRNSDLLFKVNKFICAQKYELDTKYITQDEWSDLKSHHNERTKQLLNL